MAPAQAAVAALALLLAAAARGEPPGPPPGIVTYTSLDLALCSSGDRLPAYDPGAAGLAACYEPVGWFPRTCRCLRADCAGTGAERNACAACSRDLAEVLVEAVVKREGALPGWPLTEHPSTSPREVANRPTWRDAARRTPISRCV
jgi:hypothetical protein